MMMGGGELYFRNKEFLFQNNGLKQTLHGHRLFDGLFFCLMRLCLFLLFEMLGRITDSENMWVLC